MELYFLRHGIAADRDDWSGSDFDRPLTKEGRQRLARQGKVMAKLSLRLDAVVTSPLVRAKETADIVADALGIADKVVSDERLGTDFDIGRLTGVLRDRPHAAALMLVGHEPSMSETMSRVVGGARIDFKKGGLAFVDMPDAASLQGTLVWLIAPKVFLL